MDEMVLKAMVKWPAVPACCGWLGLDGRGDWYMRDDQAQALGPFLGGHSGRKPGAKGSRLQHEKLIAFIGRNYASDEFGQWYFQNGPQRVFVELEWTPWVWRVPEGASKQVHSHTGVLTTVQVTLLDESGRLYLQTPLGLGVVHTQDILQASSLLEEGAWPEPEDIAFSQLPARYGYVLSPQANQPKE